MSNGDINPGATAEKSYDPKSLSKTSRPEEADLLLYRLMASPGLIKDKKGGWLKLIPESLYILTKPIGNDLTGFCIVI